jgi:predicted ArsR family transcriptional regulator
MSKSSGNKRNYLQREEAIALRAKILAYIQEDSRTCHQVAAKFSIAYDTALHHTKILVEEEYVERNETKKIHVYSTEYEGEYIGKTEPMKKNANTEERLVSSVQELSPAWQLMMGIRPNRTVQ